MRKWIVVGIGSIFVLIILILSAAFTIYKIGSPQVTWIIDYRGWVDQERDRLDGLIRNIFKGEKRTQLTSSKVIVEEKLRDGEYVYSLLGGIVGLEVVPTGVKIEFRDKSGQIITFPVLTKMVRSLYGDKFEVTIYELKPGSEIWEPMTREFQNYSQVKDVFCTGELVSVIWRDSRPLEFWTDANGNFKPELSKEVKDGVLVHMYREVDSITGSEVRSPDSGCK